MFGRCALRLRQCIQFARKRGVLSRCSAAGSGSLVARHRQVHAPCEAEIGNGHKRRRAKQADRHGVLGYKGARRKRLAHRSASRSRSECEPPKSRFPEIVGNIKNAEQTMEGLEGANALAKQVLSQLSYTPTVGVKSILKHFRRFRNPFLRFPSSGVNLCFETVLVAHPVGWVRNENLISVPDYFAQKLNFKPN